MRCTLPIAVALLALAACGDDTAPPSETDAPDAGEVSGDTGGADAPGDGSLSFPTLGPLSGAAGRGAFRFGAATAATQIEDNNPHVDWYTWTAAAPEGMAKGPFVGEAVRGFSKAVEDIGLMTELNLDAYRFSVEWARIEPQRDQIDDAGVAHYRAFLEGLRAASVEPMITVLHFSNPLWVDDPRDGRCDAGPTDANLCGWDHETGAEEILAELAEHATRLGQEYGHLVDDWATLNEPMNYLFAGYGAGVFPPGKRLVFDDIEAYRRLLRNYLRAHVVIYDALKAADTVDADGDGVAAHIGLTLSLVHWLPARANAPSDHPDDLAATEKVLYYYHRLYVDSLLGGTFDGDLDGTPDEDHPDWTGKLDWLGAQYYFRGGVTGETQLFPVVDATFCYPPLDFGSCLPPEDETHWVPDMGYEFWAPGLYELLTRFAARWPDLPLLVTESGLATGVGKRRAEHVVRSLEQIHRAVAAGADVRGYYHWSLMDNFEWAEGYEPHFGLYRVDRDTDSFARIPTEGATVLSAIAGERRITPQQRATYGGAGPMTPEAAHTP